MRSALTRSATSLDARETLAAAVIVGAALGAWLVTRSPQVVHTGLVGLRIVVDYCLSTS
jgi:hypothetical protein